MNEPKITERDYKGMITQQEKENAELRKQIQEMAIVITQRTEENAKLSADYDVVAANLRGNIGLRKELEAEVEMLKAMEDKQCLWKEQNMTDLLVLKKKIELLEAVARAAEDMLVLHGKIGCASCDDVASALAAAGYGEE